uniref:HMG box domain-containing protein n=1 Tax=Esox lucius TaxID=8010 RepID=A0A3P8YQI1_ESOLU
MAPFGLMSAGASFLAKSFGLFSNVSSLARCVSVLPAVKTFSSTAGAPPKRPLNGYMRFLKQQQPLIVKQYPDVSAVDVVRKIAQQWRALSPEQKQPFEQESVVARAQFKVDLQTFKAQLTPAQTAALKEERRQRLAKRKAIRRKRELNNLGKPKRPRSPFNIYMAEHFEESKGTTTTGKLKMLREDWYKLAASEKQLYASMAGQFVAGQCDPQHIIAAPRKLSRAKKNECFTRHSQKRTGHPSEPGSSLGFFLNIELLREFFLATEVQHYCCLLLGV